MLNCTISSNVQIRAAAWYADGGDRIFTMGNRVSKTTLTPERFPVRPRNRQAKLWMDVSFQIRLDAEREHLMVQKSFFGVFPSEDAKEGLCHYDYERDKPDGYPDAHLQVYGHSDLLPALNFRADAGRPLASLHFPVGGKRFRPSLEDLIEFLVVERLVEARDDYLNVLNVSRDKFRANQLRAAMRRNQPIVDEYIRQQDLRDRT